MDRQRVQKIINNSTDDETAQLTTLFNASVSLLQKYQEEHSEKNLRAWQTSEDALERLVEKLEKKYFHKEPAFKNRTEALKWLQEEGYKIEKSKLYKDADIGKLTVQADDSVWAADIRAYATTLNKVKRKSGELDPGFKIKSKKEIRKLDLQNQKYEFELARDMGKYLLKTDARTEIAVKIGALEAGLKHFVNTDSLDWIYAVGGKPEKQRVLINLFNAGLDALLDEFGNMEDIGIIILKQNIENESNPVANT